MRRSARVWHASLARPMCMIEFPTNAIVSLSRLATNLNHRLRNSRFQPLPLDAMSRYPWVILVVIFASPYLALASYLPSDQNHPTATELKYTRAHSLGRGYTFDPRDGWQTVNVSNLSYKYSPRSPNIRSTSKIISQHTSHNSLANKVKDTVKDVFKSSMGKGKPVPVTITW